MYAGIRQAKAKSGKVEELTRSPRCAPGDALRRNKVGGRTAEMRLRRSLSTRVHALTALHVHELSLATALGLDVMRRGFVVHGFVVRSFVAS